MAPTISARFAALLRLRDNATMRMLRADTWPLMAVVFTMVFDREHRVRETSDAILATAELLDELRADGFAVPDSARDTLERWATDKYLHRRPGTDSREETYELTASASQALAFIESHLTPQSTLTASRFTNVTEQIQSLARDTNPDSAERIAQLERERESLDEHIARVKEHGFDPIDERAARERINDVLSLAATIPSDFARVSEELERLDHELRTQLLDSTASKGEVLAQLFEGVDVIAESDAGHTFDAFFKTLMDDERSDTVEDAIDELLTRPFTQELSLEQRQTLTHLVGSLKDESMGVHDRMRNLSRSLRQFVESQTYAQHRALDQLLSRAQAAALQAVHTLGPTIRSDIALDFTYVQMAPISQLMLHDPSERTASVPFVTAESQPVDLAALRQRVRLSEIDFTELTTAVAETWESAPAPSVGNVLARHPATQGLASVVGLLALAHRHGVASAGTERVTWATGTGRERAATISRHLFTEHPKEWT